MQNIVWGYRGLAPYGLGLDEHVLKAVWVNARGCGKIILIARVRHFRMKKPPLVAWTLWKAVKGILGRKRTHSERIVKCAFSFFRIKRFHRPIYRPTPWASRRVLSTRSKAHVHASEGDMGKCAYWVFDTSCLRLWPLVSKKKNQVYPGSFFTRFHHWRWRIFEAGNVLFHRFLDEQFWGLA